MKGEKGRKSLIGFSEKSCGIFKGTGIIFFKDPGIQRFFEKSLISFSEKSCGNPKGEKGRKSLIEFIEKKLWDF